MAILCDGKAETMKYSSIIPTSHLIAALSLSG